MAEKETKTSVSYTVEVRGTGFFQSKKMSDWFLYNDEVDGGLNKKRMKERVANYKEKYWKKKYNLQVRVVKHTFTEVTTYTKEILKES